MKIVIKDCNCYLDDDKQYQEQFQDALIKTHFPSIVLDNNGNIKDCFDHIFNAFVNEHFLDKFKIIFDINKDEKYRRIFLELSDISMYMMTRYYDEDCVLSLDFYEYEDYKLILIDIYSKNIALSFQANGNCEEMEEYTGKVFDTVDNILKHKTRELNNLKETWDMIL